MAIIENPNMVAATTPSSTKQIAYDNSQLSTTIRKMVRYRTDSNKEKNKEKQRERKKRSNEEGKQGAT